MSLKIIFTFSFIGMVFFHGIQTFEMTLDHVLPNLFNKGASECVILVPSNISINLDWQNQKLHLDDTNSSTYAMKFKNRLTKMTTCIVSFTTQRDFWLVQDITVAVDNHVMVYFSKNSPNENMLEKIRRPLLWVQPKRSEKVLYLFHVFCAKMGKPKISKPVFVGTCSQSCCNASCFPRNVQDICFNSLKGQTIRMFEPRTFPNFLSPQLFNTGGKMSGVLFNFLLLASRIYDFEFQLNLNIDSGDFIPENLTYTPGKFHAVQKGDAEITQAAMLEIFNLLFDTIVPIYQSKLVYVTRAPIPVTSLGNITGQFSHIVWITSTATIFALAMLLYFIHILYHTGHMKAYNLAENERLTSNLWIFPFAKITEPDPLPWFKKWSTGKVVVLLWSILSTFLIHFYTSNFRASLTAIKYEKPPATLEDVLARGETVYNFDGAIVLRSEFLEAIGQSGSVKHKIAVLAEQTGGLYSFADTGGGLPKEAPHDMLKNGAFSLIEDLTMPYLYAVYPNLVREAIHIVNEEAYSYFKCIIVQKHSPGTIIFNSFTRSINEYGIPMKWRFDHLPMRAVIKPKVVQAQQKGLELKNYYMSLLMYLVMIIIASVSFAIEVSRRSFRLN